jgi:UrcA family protein
MRRIVQGGAKKADFHEPLAKSWGTFWQTFKLRKACAHSLETVLKPTSFLQPTRRHFMKINLKNIYKSMAFAAIGVMMMTAAGAEEARAQDSSHAAELTKVVTYGDLDLESMQGARILYARLRNAATRVCLPQRNRHLTDDGFPACYDSAMADAVRQINKATLTKVFNEHTGAESAGIG